MSIPISQPVRHLINGVVATGVHFFVFTLNLHVLKLNLVGVANLLAAFVGIFVAFLGNRYFVFQNSTKFALQALKFWTFYVSLALIHGIALMIWTDWHGRDYQTGFVIVIVLQVIASYFGNKYWVFR